MQCIGKMNSLVPSLISRGRPATYFVVAGVVAGVATVLRLSITVLGNLSEFASSKLTCHISVGDNDLSNPGIPVMRIPPETFQYVSPAGSSLTPVPSISFGGFGNIPLAMAVCGCPGKPWHTAQ